MIFDPSIYSNYAATASQNSRALGDSLQNAVAVYQRAKQQKEANLQAERDDELKRQQLEQQRASDLRKYEAAQREKQLEPQNILTRALQGQQLTPEEEASFNAFQQLESAQRRIDPISGEVYSPFSPVSLGGQAPAPQVAPRTSPQPVQQAPAAEGGYDTLLPPPTFGSEGRAPSPIGSRPERSIEPPRAPSGLNRRQQSEFQNLSLREQFDLRKEQREKKAKLPEVEQQYQSSIGLIDEILADEEGIKASVGGVGGIIGRQSDILPVTKAQRRIAPKLDQLKGKAFLQAFESLKGGGTITEIEGQKAEKAIARLNQTQDYDDYKKALHDFRNVLESGLKRSRGETIENGSKRLRFNPATGKLE